MEGNQDGHDLTHAQRSLSATVNQAIGKLQVLPFREKTFAEIIDIAE
jgi:hypothetical protein